MRTVGVRVLRSSPLMVYMGRNLISETTEGIWTKLKPEVFHALSESNVEIP